jgi:peptidoglycan-associated lipoprotein
LARHEFAALQRLSLGGAGFADKQVINGCHKEWDDMFRNFAGRKVALALARDDWCWPVVRNQKNLICFHRGPNDATQVAPGSDRDFIVNVGDRIYFPVDQTTLTAEGKETLRRQAQWLNQYPNVSIQVEGHADERGTREYNIALSARRSTATREFLISQGVIGSNVSLHWLMARNGRSRCAMPNRCWAQNRRSVTAITGGAQPG